MSISLLTATSWNNLMNSTSCECAKNANPALSFSGVIIFSRDCAHIPLGALNDTDAFVPCNLTVPLNVKTGFGNDGS
jgi:hypothetical protein